MYISLILTYAKFKANFDHMWPIKGDDEYFE
jgi:hypothetical protein